MRADDDSGQAKQPRGPRPHHGEVRAPAWCKVGVDGLKSRPPKERFCCAHAGGAFLSPPCEGGVGGVGQTGVGRRTSASSVYSPFARKDVRKRHAIQAGEAAHAPSTSSIDRAKHASLVHSTLTRPPPLTPPSQGGERRGCARGICGTNSEGIQEWCNPDFTPPRCEGRSRRGIVIGPRRAHGDSSPFSAASGRRSRRRSARSSRRPCADKGQGLLSGPDRPHAARPAAAVVSARGPQPSRG